MAVGRNWQIRKSLLGRKDLDRNARRTKLKQTFTANQPTEYWQVKIQSPCQPINIISTTLH